MTAHRPTRVLMTADAIGGVWTYCLNLARATEPLGFEYLLAVMGPPPNASQLDCAHRLPNVQVESAPFALEWMPDPWIDVDAAGEWLLQREVQHAPDIVHLNGFCHASLPFDTPKLVVGHSCCLTWSRAIRNEPRPAPWTEYHARVSQGIADADAFIAPTHAMLAMYQHTYACLPAARVIYNGAAPPTTPVTEHDKRQLLLCAGRAWDEAKNIRCVVDAAPAISWPIELAGDLGAFSDSLAPPQGLTLLGRLSATDMHAALARASIYVHPAKYEPFGLLPLEAALHRCALVLSDIPTLRELWDGAAAFFDPDSPPALARAVDVLMHDPTRRIQLANLAHRRALSYSLDRFGTEYARLYQELQKPTSSSGTHTSRTLTYGTDTPCASRCSITRS